MKKNLGFVSVLLLMAVFPTYSGAAMNVCSCVNEPIKTDEKAKLCKEILDTMTPEETVNAKGECNAKLTSKKGLDACSCLKTFHTDPEVITACEEIIGKDTKPSEMAQLAAKCP